MKAGVGAGGCSYRGQDGRIGEGAFDGGGEGLGIAVVVEETESFLVEEFGGGATPGSDDGKTTHHGFGSGKAKGLLPGAGDDL